MNSNQNSTDHNSTETKPETASVQVLSNEYVRRMQDYAERSSKTSEAVLGFCETVSKACKSLTKADLKEFRRLTKLENKVTFSQFKTIGTASARLRTNAASLPSSWYTLYQIAKLQPEVVEAAVAAGTLTSLSTQRDIRALKGAAARPARPDYSVTIDLVADAAFDPARAKEFFVRLDAFLKAEHARWDCVAPELRLTKQLQSEMATKEALRNAA